MAEQLAEEIPLIRELDGVVNLDFSRRSRSGVKLADSDDFSASGET